MSHYSLVVCRSLKMAAPSAPRDLSGRRRGHALGSVESSRQLMGIHYRGGAVGGGCSEWG